MICDVSVLTKEIFSPKDADRFLYNLVNFMVVSPRSAFNIFLLIKGGNSEFYYGRILYPASFQHRVVGILLAGWGSNNSFR